MCGVNDNVARRKAKDIVGPNGATFVDVRKGLHHA